MQEPPFPDNESERVASLRKLGLLDTDAEERFDRYTRIVKRLLNAPVALVSLVDSNRQWFKSRQGLDAVETPRKVSFCGHAILGDDVLVVEDALQDERFADNPIVVGDPKVRFYAGCPLVAPDGHHVGTLCVIDHEPRRFSRADIAVLQDFGELVSGEMASLERATTDELTGLSNRRGLAMLAEQCLAAQSRSGEPVCLVMLDMDGFGVINERFGMQEGDDALRRFAALLQSNFRNSDVVARLGGDEFCVLLSSTDAEHAPLSLQRLEREVERENRQADRAYTLAYSAGIVQHDAAVHADLAALLHDADAFMYEQKAAKKRSGTRQQE